MEEKIRWRVILRKAIPSMTVITAQVHIFLEDVGVGIEGVEAVEEALLVADHLVRDIPSQERCSVKSRHVVQRFYSGGRIKEDREAGLGVLSEVVTIVHETLRTPVKALTMMTSTELKRIRLRHICLSLIHPPLRELRRTRQPMTMAMYLIFDGLKR